MDSNRFSGTGRWDEAETAPGSPIPLTSDIVFKYIFGSPGSTKILRSLLSAVQTDAGFPAVAEVTIANPFNLQEFADAELSVVDVKAVDVTGTVFTIEVQAEREEGFLKRALYYWASGYYRQLVSANPYSSLSRTIGVNILDYRLFPKRRDLHTAFILTALGEPALRMSDDLLIHTIELPKLPALRDSRGSLSTELGRWAYYLKRRGNENAMEDPILLQTLQDDPEIQDAEERYREFMADPQLYYRYEARQRFLHQQATNLEAARKEGIEKGIEQGIKQGIDRGRREQQMQTTRRMIELGIDPQTIATATGLTLEEIGKI